MTARRKSSYKKKTLKRRARDAQHRSLRAIGAEFDLGETDLRELNAAVERVYDLMRDCEWYSRAEICLAAGTGGVPASEGLRRMRALRALFVLTKERDGDRREWRYRIVRALTADEIFEQSVGDGQEPPEYEE